MDLPNVMIEDNYSDFLAGKEVEATVMHHQLVEKGKRVMAFHHSIAVSSLVTVPREKQSQYVGVEAQVMEAYPPGSGSKKQRVRVVRV